ncbi:hypothetical protein F5B18DRAFT_640685 [Nemania serpens]|nr:hypothetical protein F5B18DRAFT_640685 [Nemania serpens]
MPSTSSQDIKSSQTRQSARTLDEQNADIKGADSDCNSPTILTGEFRMSFRARIQRMRDGKDNTPAPLNLVAHKHASSDSIKAPVTPPIHSPSPECPGAPRKRKIHDFR